MIASFLIIIENHDVANIQKVKQENIGYNKDPMWFLQAKRNLEEVKKIK